MMCVWVTLYIQWTYTFKKNSYSIHMVDGGKKKKTKKEGIKKLLGGKDDYDDDVIFQMIKSR